MSKIFLCHSSIDKVFARKLTADLRINGHDVWIDEIEIKVGDSLIGKIRDGLNSVDFVIAVISKSSIESEWVKKELDIATNREIEEKKVIVLPILIEHVDLPGFLKGKLYDDFSDEKLYNEKLQILLNSFGDSKPIVKRDLEELRSFKRELDEAKKIVMQYQKELSKVTNYIFSTKSKKLKEAIIKDNIDNPEFSPINNVYAFEVFGIPITLGYLLFSLQKALIRGTHVLDAAFTIENKWEYAFRMLEAFSEMIKAQENKH